MSMRHRLSELPKRPSFWIAVDSSLTAATNSALLIAGSRLLGPSSLVPLAMLQLFASSAILVQRATLLAPALAARRELGVPASMPGRWAWVSIPAFAAPVIATCPFVMGASENWLTVALITTFFVISSLGMDFVRYFYISRDSPQFSVVMDGFFIFTLAPTSILIAFQPSWIAFAIGWSTSASIAAAGTALILRRKTPSFARQVPLRGTIKLGRWSGLDNLMSVIANLVPMAIATLTLTTPLAAIYRVLQTALGPLNIVNTSLIASFSLGSWRLSSIEGIENLRGQVRRGVRVLLLATVIYVGIAFAAIMFLAELPWSSSARVVAILSIAALFGAWTSPIAAASSALGYQIIGVYIRIAVVAFSLSVSWAVAIGLPVPLDDPIGAVAIASSALGLIGWGFGYIIALRREKRLLG
ncbi:hypothetical protein QE412_003054 [Microbacterium trichothecenolyticum]|uniref:O-antigen/teichoic acid export membrane protein n=2 Tax=Microbacterium trichothecenolyticum TaxID=69370 RepID=A0ABU0TXV5_MICTR|nr:hypothetical protein [Microbacterium trichothecenolyticum]